MSPIRINKCAENEYGCLYEFFPSVHHKLRQSSLPNGLEIRNQKKYANWTCYSDDELRVIDKLSGVSKQMEVQLQDPLHWKRGFYTVNTGTIIETQPFPRITTHRLFRHQPGEIWTYGDLRPGFVAKEVDIECRNIHVNADGQARFIWYMTSITPDCVYESRI